MKTKNIFFILLILVLLSIVISAYLLSIFQKRNSAIPSGTSPITIGILTSDEDVITRYQALADYLNEHSGESWRIEPVKDSGSFIEQIENHKIESAFVGSAAGYRMIRDNLGIPIARPEKDGVSTYKAYIVARKDRDIYAIDELKNKRFAYADINMSAGYLFPVYLLKSKGYDPDSFFRAVTFLGTSEKVIDSVVSGNFDAGAVKSTELSSLTKKKPEIQNLLSVIAEDGPFPDNTFMMSVNFDHEFAKKIQEILLDMPDTEKGKNVLEKINFDRFIISDEKDFNKVEVISNY